MRLLLAAGSRTLMGVSETKGPVSSPPPLLMIYFSDLRQPKPLSRSAHPPCKHTCKPVSLVASCVLHPASWMLLLLQLLQFLPSFSASSYTLPLTPRLSSAPYLARSWECLCRNAAESNHLQSGACPPHTSPSTPHPSRPLVPAPSRFLYILPALRFVPASASYLVSPFPEPESLAMRCTAATTSHCTLDMHLVLRSALALPFFDCALALSPHSSLVRG